MYHVIYVGEHSTQQRIITSPEQQEQQNQQSVTNEDQGNDLRLQDITREPTSKPFYWNERASATFVNELNDACDMIIYWKNNLLLVTTKAAGKVFISGMNRI